MGTSQDVCWTTESPDNNAATAIRRSMAIYLKGRINEREALPEAEIVIGELVANAVRHAPGPICADLEWRGEHRPVVVVHDAGPCFQSRPLPNDMFAESGRGLHIARALADDVRIQGVEPHGCLISAALRLTKHPDADAGPTPCPRGERRWKLGCACALEVHGLAPSGAPLASTARTD